MLIALFLVAVTAQGDPACPLFTVKDPASGSQYTYDLSQFKVPDTDQASFIQGSERGQKWIAYLNVCGNAKTVGCSADTPICQDDAAGSFYIFGTSASWTMAPYYNPAQGSNFPQYDQGVTVSINGGWVCGNGVARQAFLWFKCDPTVTERPTTVSVAETDPVTSQPTPCKYFFAPIRHASFCPRGASAPASIGAEFSMAPLVSQALGQVSVATTSPVPFLGAGLTCTKSKLPCTPETPLFSCTGSVPLGQIAEANVTQLQFGTGAASWTFGSVPVGAGSGNCSEPGPFLTATGQGSWALSDSVYTAYSGSTAVLTLKGTSAVSCNSCKQRSSKSRRH